MTKRLIALLLILFCGIASAQTRYVSDDFEIMMRTGPSVQNKIIRVLRSGTPIEVLREDAGNGHSQVQTMNGEIGYVLTRFLINTPSAKSRLERLQKQLQQLKSNPNDLRNLYATSQEDNRGLIEQNTTLTEQLRKAQAELERIKKASGGGENIFAKNERLEKEVQQLLLQLDDIRIQNEDLKDQSNRMNTLFGGGLVLIGLLLGWILSLSGRRSRNGSWGR